MTLLRELDTRRAITESGVEAAERFARLAADAPRPRQHRPLALLGIT